MPAPSSGRDSRRGSRSGGESGLRTAARTEKAKSSQVYGHAGGASGGSASQRPSLGTRTSSAPLVERRRGSGYATGMQRLPPSQEHVDQAGTGAVEPGQDEDEAAGVVGAMRQYEPFRSPQPEEPIPEMNIAVIGGDGVGKSTFMQRALDLPLPSPTKAADRKIPYDGTLYRIRLLEISIDDVDIDDDDTVSWPASVADRMMPHIDGVLTLYNVADRTSLEDVPETLIAIHKAALPSVLISCKCDTAPAERQLDPVGIEARAKHNVKSLRAVQTSLSSPETFKMGLATLVKAVVNGHPDQHHEPLHANRQRAQSNAVRSVSPRAPGLPAHARANSDYTASLYRDRGHSRHDSSLVTSGSNDHLKVPGDSDKQMSDSFLLEESGAESISGSQRSSTDVEAAASSILNAQPTTALSENGATFEELVDRLLSQPTSKADGKFVVIFLALYRKFAAPGRLLEAIVERFDALERNGTPLMIKMVTQLRILSVMEQWISHYPGDFAYQKTRRRMRTFIAKISGVAIFQVAAKELGSGLEMVQEDDDTEWGYTDRNRNTSDSNTYRWTMSKTASILIDDDSFIFPDNVSIANDDVSLAPSTGGETIRSMSSTTSSHLMLNFESAQRQASLILPRDRIVLSKLEWRMLMGLDDSLIARELTRMDWTMFSSIRPRDLVRQVSLKPAEQAVCKNLVNVNRMIDHFNHLTSWVANFILLRDKPKHRAMMLEKMMRIARKLRELNNYNALGAFLASIRGTAVHRLAATRELIPPAIGKDWMKLEILMSHTRSFSAYRLAWDNSSAERIPYIPLHRRDLVTAEEGNRTFIGDERTGRINWKKFEVMGEVIVGLQKAQGLPYRGLGNGRMGEQARELVMDVKLVKDDDDLYEMSTQCEPIAGSGGTATAKFRNFFGR